jgi:F0F1-type ATP synthase membrane subunit b/b'
MMKKILLVASLTSVLLFTNCGEVLAVETGTRAASAAAKLQDRLAQKDANQQARVTNLKAKADAEINRRLTTLNNAVNRINNAKKLSAADKASLTTLIQSDITNLTTLKAKIDADTDLAVLKTDIESIVKDYRIYAMAMPKVELIALSDAILSNSDNLNNIITKFQDLINKAQSEGKDMSKAQTALADMQAKLADAKTQAQSVHDSVMPLTPEGYPGNKSTLESARNNLKTAKGDLQAARADAKMIITALRAALGKTKEGTPAAKTTPSAI